MSVRLKTLCSPARQLELKILQEGPASSSQVHDQTEDRAHPLQRQGCGGWASRHKFAEGCCVPFQCQEFGPMSTSLRLWDFHGGFRGVRSFRSLHSQAQCQPQGRCSVPWRRPQPTKECTRPSKSEVADPEAEFRAFVCRCHPGPRECFLIVWGEGGGGFHSVAAEEVIRRPVLESHHLFKSVPSGFCLSQTCCAFLCGWLSQNNDFDDHLVTLQPCAQQLGQIPLSIQPSSSLEAASWRTELSTAVYMSVLAACWKILDDEQ